MEDDVYCVFKITDVREEPTLWKIFRNREGAEDWISENKHLGRFIWEPWSVR